MKHSFLPKGSSPFDSPGKDFNTDDCVANVDENKKPVISTSNKCSGAWADDDNVIHGAPYKHDSEIIGPFSSVDPNGRL